MLLRLFVEFILIFVGDCGGGGGFSGGGGGVGGNKFVGIGVVKIFVGDCGCVGVGCCCFFFIFCLHIFFFGCWEEIMEGNYFLSTIVGICKKLNSFVVANFELIHFQTQRLFL